MAQESKAIKLGVLCTVYYVRATDGQVMVGLFRRNHENGDPWFGRIQPGFSGLVKPGETPRAAIARELREEVPLLEGPANSGRVKIVGGEEGLVSVMPRLFHDPDSRQLVRDHTGPDHVVSGFLVELDELDVRNLFYTESLREFVTQANAISAIIYLARKESLDALFRSGLTDRIRCLIGNLPTMSFELSYPVFVPLSAADSIARHASSLLMPHYVQALWENGEIDRVLGPITPLTPWVHHL